MRFRILIATVFAVIVSVFLLAIPLGTYASMQIWRAGQVEVDSTLQSFSRAIDRRVVAGETVTHKTLVAWLGGEDNGQLYVRLPDGSEITAGKEPHGSVFDAGVTTATGARVTLVASASDAVEGQILLGAIITVGIGVSLLAGWMIALRSSRRISSPLIYLAAQAEQLGSGNVRAQVRPSGIEEIDLVQAELARTGERLAGRIAAERQFASDASHQLRTPLTALSMRLEEIEMISTEDEVREEARICLEQAERLTNVVEDLLKNSRRAGGGTTQAINISGFFRQQSEEWEPAFKAAGRRLEFVNDTDRPALATPGSLGQVIATLVENSLNYGAGTTTVTARMSPNGKGIFFEVGDEGEGVDDEIAPDIFKKGVSGHGSSGIGLALARQLIEADGGRIELVQRRPPLFSAYVNAVPAALDPDKVLPQGAIISISGVKRRF